MILLLLVITINIACVMLNYTDGNISNLFLNKLMRHQSSTFLYFKI